MQLLDLITSTSYPTLSLFLLLPPPLPPLPLLLIRNNSDLATLTGMHE